MKKTNPTRIMPANPLRQRDHHPNPIRRKTLDLCGYLRATSPRQPRGSHGRAKDKGGDKPPKIDPKDDVRPRPINEDSDNLPKPRQMCPLRIKTSHQGRVTSPILSRIYSPGQSSGATRTVGTSRWFGATSENHKSNGNSHHGN